MSTPESPDLLILDLLHSIASGVRALAGEVRELREALPIPLVDVSTAARLAGVSEKTIRRKIRSGEIPARRVGRAVRLDPTKLRVTEPSGVVAHSPKRP